MSRMGVLFKEEDGVLSVNTQKIMDCQASYDLVKTMRKSPSAKTLAQIFSAVDKAVKRNIIHANKAARFKSRLAALLAKK